MPIYNSAPELFLSNKFTNCYFFVIKRAQSQNRQKRSHDNAQFVYYESHHIVPRSLGGPDTLDNLVLLTAYEHYLCHWLLTKMCINREHRNKMLFPLRCMTNRNRLQSLKNLAHLYEASKADLARASSELNRGRKHSKATCDKQSKIKKGEGNNMYGKAHTDATVEKMINKKQGENNPNYGKTFSNDHKTKIVESLRDKNAYGFTNKSFLVVWPDGREEVVTNRQEFAKSHGFRAGSISTAAVTGKLYRGMKIGYLDN